MVHNSKLNACGEILGCYFTFEQAYSLVVKLSSDKTPKTSLLPPRQDCSRSKFSQVQVIPQLWHSSYLFLKKVIHRLERIEKEASAPFAIPLCHGIGWDRMLEQHIQSVAG